MPEGRKYSTGQTVGVGDVFSRLTVLEEAGRSRWGERRVRVRCVCGNERIVAARYLALGHTRSCGCLQRERAAEHATAHGQSGHPLHSTWRNMIHRCTSTASASYPRYGGRGIVVCDRWRDDFTAFCADVGERPPGAILERIDPDGPYAPQNCRWRLPSDTRAAAMRAVRVDTPHGAMTLGEAAQHFGLHVKTLKNRIDRGWPAERLFEPAKHRR